MENLNKTNNRKNVKSLSLKKGGRKNYAILSRTILAIVVLHFAFQFSFIQSENFRLLQNLTKNWQFGQTENIAENTSVPEITKAYEEEKVKAEPVEKEVKKAKPITVKKRQTSTAVRKRTRPEPTQNVIKRKAPQPETRAERLRRAEKILTGA